MFSTVLFLKSRVFFGSNPFISFYFCALPCMGQRQIIKQSAPRNRILFFALFPRDREEFETRKMAKNRTQKLNFLLFFRLVTGARYPLLVRIDGIVSSAMFTLKTGEKRQILPNRYNLAEISLKLVNFGSPFLINTDSGNYFYVFISSVWSSSF